MSLMNLTILSGGQTGVDRAALDVAIYFGLPHGGWCPRGRRAEDGPIPSRYSLQETPSAFYVERTRWNIRDSDATVVFSFEVEVRGGTLLTIQLAEQFGKPCLHLSGERDSIEVGVEQLLAFVQTHEVQRLNVAGPRASQEPEAESFARNVLSALADAQTA